jgi:hypothetical protein
MRHTSKELPTLNRQKKTMRFTNFISIILLTIFFSGSTFAQKNMKKNKIIEKNCSCKNNPLLIKIISCDTTFFYNGSKLYRQFNCDSSWLTFENKNKVKKIMASMNKSSIELTERIGYQFVKEYEKTLLFENRQASGGGFPFNFELINKENGEMVEELGAIIYYTDDTVNNFILYLTTESLDTLTFYNIDTEKKYNFLIPKDRLLKTIQESETMFPEFLFEEPKKENNILTLSYKYLINDSPEKWNKDKIIIDLNTTK